MGGFDIFISDFENKTWGTPMNIGYPLNTTDDDTFFFPIKNGTEGYYSKNMESKGDEDIYHVLLDNKFPR